MALKQENQGSHMERAIHCILYNTETGGHREAEAACEQRGEWIRH